jgi:hypothetical protein
MNKEFGIGLRREISNNSTIKSIIDFADIQVFENATNYTGIFEIVNQAPPYTFSYQKYVSNVNSIEINDFINSLNNPELYEFCYNVEVKSNEITKASWVFKNESDKIITELIEKNSIPLKEYVKYIFVGIQSGKDEVFFVSEDLAEQYRLEKEILYPILKGKDVRRYQVNWSNTFIIYPYNLDNSVIPEKEMSAKYPMIYKYLQERKGVLSGRSYFDNSNKIWYELWCERSLNKFKETKIVNAEISPENRFYLDKYGFLGNTKIFSTVLKNEYQYLYSFFIGLLNSSLMNYYHKLIASPKTGGFFDYKTQFISLYPILLNSKIEFAINILSTAISCSVGKNESIYNQTSKIIDALVFELYFSDHMKEREIDILQFAENIDSFAEKSTDILKPILES